VCFCILFGMCVCLVWCFGVQSVCAVCVCSVCVFGVYSVCVSVGVFCVCVCVVCVREFVLSVLLFGVYLCGCLQGVYAV